MVRSRAGWMGAALAVAALIAQGAWSPATVSAADEVSTLAGMSGAQRRKTLASMSASARQSLLFNMKRQQAAARGAMPAASGSNPYLQGGHPINVRRGGVRASAVGTIRYDDGVGTTSFGFGSPSIIGNRFNTHTGIPVLASGTVSAVQAVVVPGSAVGATPSAGFVLEGPQTVGGGAMAIFSTFTGGLTAATETVNYGGIGANYTGSSFFVLFGDFASSYILAFGPGTNLGQGHHGVIGNTGGMGPNIVGTTPLTGLNALVRVSGNIVPVELMTFEVE